MEKVSNTLGTNTMVVLSPKKLEIIRRLACAERILSDPDSVNAVNSLSLERFEMISKFHDTCFGIILHNPASVEALNSLSLQKLKILICRCPDMWFALMLENPTFAQNVNYLSLKRFGMISKLHDLCFVRILQNSASVEAVNSFSLKKLKILICRCPAMWFALTLGNPTFAQNVNYLNLEKFEIISKSEGKLFGRMLQDPAFVQGVNSLSVQKIEILLSKLHVMLYGRILQNPASVEAVNCLSPEKCEIIIKLCDTYFETIFRYPASVQSMNSLSTAKLSAMVDIIEASQVQNLLIDPSTITKILDVDIERNIKFTSVLDDKTENIVDRNLDYYLDSEIICSDVIRFIESYKFSENERVPIKNSVKNAAQLVFMDTKCDDGISRPTRLQELSLLEFLRKL